ncbi:hypothetical protein RQ734_17405 [Roseomonas mucosa]|uniref:hypothetical protein n=1 Tax=Roseomonas mucosa TaxID=207340 RepID=UPI001EF6BFED|nr:hypothetical protein [Roseomonas mucosa]MCG7353850.1 hypothetical protein [Roseomonas mucosa]MDT8277849.1 hypothetical protein [Roseomonas mucosa]
MKIELRSVAYSARLSEETMNFHAEVWIDGKKAGYAQNHGTGGNTNVLPNSLRERLDEYGKTLPQVDIGTSTGGEPHLIVQDAEWIVDSLLTEWIMRRDLKRALKNRVLYTHTEMPGVYQTKVLKPDEMAKILASTEVKAKWKVKAWLNTIPEDEAIAIYRNNGR